MNEFSPEQLQALSEAVGKLSEALNPAHTNIVNLSNAAAGAASKLSGVNLNPLQQAAAQAAKEASGSAAALKLLGASASQYSKAFMSGTKGTGKYSDAVSTAGDAVQAFGLTLGPLGKAATLAAGALFKLAASSLKQNDALISAYQKFSDFGAIDAAGTEGIKDLTHKFGVTAENMGNLQAVLASISPTMTAFGGSVKGGIDRFAELNKDILYDKQGTELVLKKMGLSTEQITEYAGKFVVDQTKYGLSQGKSTNQLKESFVDLMKVTTELADITGQSRDAQLKQFEENQRDVRWRMHLAGLSEKERKEQEVALVGWQAISKGAGELYKDLKTSGGAVTSQYTAMQRNIYGNILQTTQNELAKGGDMGMAMARAFKQSGQTMENFLKTFQGGKFTLPTEALQALGIGADTLDGQQKIAGMSLEKLAEKFRMMAEAQQKRMELGVTQEKSERNSLMMADDLTYAVGNLAVPAITGMAWITNKVNEGLAGFLKLITRGKVDYTAQFKTFNSLEDATEALNKAKEDEIALIKEKADLDKEIFENNKRIKEAQDRGEDPNSMWSNLHALLKDRQTLQQRRSDIEARQTANKAGATRAEAARRDYGAKEGASASEVLNFSGGSGDMEHFLQLNGAFRNQILQAGKQYQEATGNKLTVNSGYRSEEEQVAAYKKWKDAGGSKDKPYAGGYYMPALPKSMGGKGSDHGSGLAVDIQEQNAEAIRALQGAGLRRPMGNKDPVHWTAASGGVFKGPGSGYMVELHGHEAVVPMAMFKNYLKGIGQQDGSSNVTKTTLHNTMPTFTAPTSSSDMSRAITDLFEMMVTKLDDMIDQQRRTVNVNEQILSNAKH